MDLKCKNEDEVIKLLELIDFNECYFNKENNFEKGNLIKPNKQLQ